MRVLDRYDRISIRVSGNINITIWGFFSININNILNRYIETYGK
jgi:hypothetical protein